MENFLKIFFGGGGAGSGSNWLRETRSGFLQYGVTIGIPHRRTVLPYEHSIQPSPWGLNGSAFDFDEATSKADSSLRQKCWNKQ